MNVNIAMLTSLYDKSAKSLYQALSSNKLNTNDEQVKNQVEYLGQIAQTLLYVLQVEKARRPVSKQEDQQSTDIPDEANTPKMEGPAQTKPDSLGLSGFASPGGWQP